jgi:hypothetical protein
MKRQPLSELKEIFGKQNRVLFLENDNILDHFGEKFEKFLIEEKQQYNVLFDIRDLSLEYIINQIENFDIIVFQSTFTTKETDDLYNKLRTSKFIMPKTVIQLCYGKEINIEYEENSSNKKLKSYAMWDKTSFEKEIDIREWRLFRLTRSEDVDGLEYHEQDDSFFASIPQHDDGSEIIPEKEALNKCELLYIETSSGFHIGLDATYLDQEEDFKILLPTGELINTKKLLNS